MKNLFSLSALILASFAVDSYADSIPTYAITSAQFDVQASDCGGGAACMAFIFTGPNILIGGSGTAGAPFRREAVRRLLALRYR
jgi:hypothetical protein